MALRGYVSDFKKSGGILVMRFGSGGHSAQFKAAVVGLTIASAGAVLAACGSGSSSSAASGSSQATTTTSGLASAAAFYKGKTITFIAPDAPGGDFDLYARILAPAFSQILGATVNVVNIAVAGDIGGAEKLAASTPDGLTIGFTNPGGDIASSIEKSPSVNFNLADLNYIGRPGVSPVVVLTSPTSGFTSFSQLEKVKTPIKVVDIRNGTGDTMARIIFGAFAIPHTFITGFPEVAQLKQGFLAGDGQFMVENLPPFRSMLQGGQAKALLTTFEPTLPALANLVNGATTLQEALKSVTLSPTQQAAVSEGVILGNLIFTLAAPAGTPANRVALLRAAFQKVVKMPSVIAQATKEGEPLNSSSGQTVASEVKTAIADGSAISPYVNG